MKGKIIFGATAFGGALLGTAARAWIVRTSEKQKYKQSLMSRLDGFRKRLYTEGQQTYNTLTLFKEDVQTTAIQNSEVVSKRKQLS